MKKVLLLVLFGSGLVGCSHNMTKEQTTDVFKSIEARDLNHAREVHDENAYQNSWEMPDGETLTHGEFTRTMEQGISYINTCDQLVKSLQETTESFASSVDNDEENAVTEAEESVSEIEPSFRTKCEFVQQGWDRLPIVRIKKLTKVDLFVDHDGTKKKFDDSLTNLKATLIVHNKAIAAAEKNFRTSEAEDTTSKSYYEKKMCETAAIVSYTGRNIAEEKKAAEVSGVVDKDKLYQNGQSLNINKQRLSEMRVQFKTRYGSEFDQTSCPN